MASLGLGRICKTPRTSATLTRLEQAKAKLQASQLDLNALDEFVNFTAARKAMDESIAGFNSAQGSAADYAAQGARGLLGLGKDTMMGLGEMAYEAAKALPKLARTVFTSKGRAIAWLDAQIAAENIRLGNTTPGTVGQGVLDIGSAIVKPVTEPWAKGQYVEAVTRGVAEVATLPVAWTKAQKAAQAAKIKAALELENAAKAKTALKVEETAKSTGGMPAKGLNFKMREMMDVYKGENLPGNKQWPGKQVKYLNIEEREVYKLEIKNGKFYDSDGNLFDTAGGNSLHSRGSNNAIFVMDENGNIFASKMHAAGEFHHSSFLSGNPVAAAGEIKVTNGTLEFISGKSGHYRPLPIHLEQAIDVMKNKNVDISKMIKGKF